MNKLVGFNVVSGELPKVLYKRIEGTQSTKTYEIILPKSSEYEDVFIDVTKALCGGNIRLFKATHIKDDLWELFIH